MKVLNRTRLVIVIFAIFIGMTTIAGYAKSTGTLIIAGETIERGTKKSWNLIVGETALGPVGVPITVINGRRNGPVLAVTAGCHPTEVTGIMTSIRLAKEIDPEKLAGTLLIVHVQNVMGFVFKTRYVSPLDNINFVNAYPLEKIGEVPEQEPGVMFHQGTSLSHYSAQKIASEIITRADYHIDLHGGTVFESLPPNIEIAPTGRNTELDEKIRDMAKAFGFDIIWETPRGSIPEIPSYGRAKRRGGPGSVSIMNGIPAVTCEIGSEGKLEEKLIEMELKGIINVMIHLDMLEGEKVPHKSRVLVGGHVFFAKRGGLWMTKCKAGDRLSKGQILGQTINLSGEVVETFKSPSDGFLMNVGTQAVVNPGDMLYVIGNIVE